MKEIISLRTPREKHFQNEDGTFTMYAYKNNVHFHKEGKFIEKDNTIIEKNNFFIKKDSKFLNKFL